MTVRQSIKTILAAYVACGLLAAAILVYWLSAPAPAAIPLWAPLLVPALLGLWAGARHLLRLTTKLTIDGDRIRYQSGLLSRTTRVMELAKVQDVRVDQSLGQRIIRVGDLSLETAGETSRITIPSIDQPRRAADRILELSSAQKPR